MLIKLRSIFQYRKINVTVDSRLFGHLINGDNFTVSNKKSIININLYKLIMSIGIIKSRWFSVSSRQKFSDYSYLIEKLHDSQDFKVRINDIRNMLGSEALGEISEDFGVGLSIVIADKLFGLKQSTISRINASGKRPDWEAQTQLNKRLVIESKGTTNKNTRNKQIINAKNQLSTVSNADISAASITLLQESQITENEFIDPPTISDTRDKDLYNKILMATHYASVLSFFGDSYLSIYFSEMKNRIRNALTIEEAYNKNIMFREIKKKYSTYVYRNMTFKGKFWLINKERTEFLFLGIHEDLLSFKGFLQFKEVSELEENIECNQHILFSDSVLIIEITNINYFSKYVDINKIINYQSINTISDIDEMNEFTFSKYFEYILRINNFVEIKQEDLVYENNYSADMTALKNSVRYVFEFKIFRIHKLKKIDTIKLLKMRQLNSKVILVTNSKVDDGSVIDRGKLINILQNPSSLMKYI